MAEKQIAMISDGPYGKSILYSDGSTEPVPEDDVEPPPLVGDLNFEEARAGFEVWLSERIVRDHEDLIDQFLDWLREQPEVVAIRDDVLGVMNRPGSDGGSGYWIPTSCWSVCWSA